MMPKPLVQFLGGSMGSIDERRRGDRRVLDTTILFRPVEAGGPFRSAMMRDISDGGVSFDTDDPPAKGDVVDMFFKEHEAAADRRIRGQVAWTQPAQPGFTSVGIAFQS
jgi:Tfp pilus assembly protein PilZ